MKRDGVSLLRGGGGEQVGALEKGFANMPISLDAVLCRARVLMTSGRWFQSDEAVVHGHVKGDPRGMNMVVSNRYLRR